MTSIRQISAGDAEAAAKLSEELGYPATVDDMRQRIAEITLRRDNTVYIACAASAVLGWIDVGIVYHLTSGAYGEIGGLVVAPAHRNQGIGRKLVAAAERWIADQHVSKVVVRSRIAREDAHRFYLHQGYSKIKTSAVFSKQLS